MPSLEMRSVAPSILYFGTPVALVSSSNDDGSTNLAPMSSFWALGWTMMLGCLDATRTAENLERHPECVVNIPSPELWPNVEKLAPLTGKDSVPGIKADKFRFAKEKFEAAGLTPCDSERVAPQRAAECPVQLEARVNAVRKMKGEKLDKLGGGVSVEVEILRAHVAADLLVPGTAHVDPARWSPLIYNFRHYFRLAETELGRTFRAET